MYKELYETWKKELENIGLVKLPSDFYQKVADYVRRLKEESRMLDKKTVKAKLIAKEMQNVGHMILELSQRRCRKLLVRLGKEEKVLPDVLTPEEEAIYKGTCNFAGSLHGFTKEILRGRLPKGCAKKEQNREVLRFLESIPTIVGVDMKTYGPFEVEDVASLPIANANILLKQGLAKKVELE